MSAEFTMFGVEATNQEWKKAEDEGSLQGEITLRKAENMDVFKDNIAYERLFGIPRINGVGYQKVFTECLMNAFQMLSSATSKTLKKYDGETTQDGLPIELRNQVAEIGNVLQWVANSTSWRNGEYYPFDAFEIEQKLKHCIGYSYYALSEEQATKKWESPSFQRDTLGELVNAALEELEYEPRFFYTFDGQFALYRREQSRKGCPAK